MSVLHDERAAIVAAVTAAGTPAHDHLPGRLVPPCALVIAGSPYIEHRPDDPVGTYTARFDVQLVERAAANDVATKSLDDRIEAVAEALIAAGFGLDSVDEPFVYKTQNAALLAAIVTVTTSINLK
ncbi:hypothetical protein [Agromyces sp. S2-1-8]|uniref:hypothetical protein n=1 Tax=Agromyces sp. S2-1-8 TaxID=2897180 RepID=UPI001E5759E0|nr:hypothetical protein [Agromyces sp. S2-1-8]MCD5345053.1 hypothetical protein [Agromyces sp. S2-1-8]